MLYQFVHCRRLSFVKVGLVNKFSASNELIIPNTYAVETQYKEI